MNLTRENVFSKWRLTSVGVFGADDMANLPGSKNVVARGVDADILLTNKTVLTGESIDRLPNLKFIGVLATGVNVVDLDAARRRQIPVSNVPEYSTDSVAQHVMAVILSMSTAALADAISLSSSRETTSR